MDDARHNTLTDIYTGLLHTWMISQSAQVVRFIEGSRGENPRYADYLAKYKAWGELRPKQPIFLGWPREMNIVYSIIRGKPYEKIEAKVREHNGPSRYGLKKLCEYYKIDYAAIEAQIQLVFDSRSQEW